MVQTFSLYALVGVDWQSTRWHEVPLAPPLGELLSEREAEGVYPVEWKMLPISSRHCRGRYKTGGTYSLTYDTPSVSPFGLTAPSEREPRRLRRWREAKSLPYGCRENRKRMPFNLLSL